MAIKSNRKIDFEYEFESPSGSYSILLRFHHTEEYGPTIGVLGEDNEPAINFPVTMFSEVSDYLTEQGILEGRKTTPIQQAPYKLPRTSDVPSKTPFTLPRPKLIAGKPSLVNPLKIGNKSVREVVDLNLDNDNGEDFLDVPSDMMEDIRKEKERLEGIHASVAGLTPTQSLSNSADQVELSEDEVAQMMKERQNASLKAKNSAKSIRRKDE